jgi:hypothetical protein
LVYLSFLANRKPFLDVVLIPPITSLKQEVMELTKLQIRQAIITRVDKENGLNDLWK